MKVYRHAEGEGIYIQITEASEGWPAWICLRSDGKMVLCSHHSLTKESHRRNLSIINDYWTKHAVGKTQLEFNGKALYKALSALVDKYHV